MFDWLLTNIEVEHFSHVFAVAFGLNALLYFFEVKPMYSKMLGRVTSKFYQVVEEAKIKGVNLGTYDEVYLPVHMVQSLHSFSVLVFPWLASLGSAIALAMLCWPAFDKSAEAQRWVMLVLVLFSVGYVPFFMWQEKLSVKTGTTKIEKHIEMLHARIEESGKGDKQK